MGKNFCSPDNPILSALPLILLINFPAPDQCRASVKQPGARNAVRSIAALFLSLVAVGAAMAAPAARDATSGSSALPIVQAAFETTAKIPPPIVATGLPVPRWVSVKSGRVNVRRGPSFDQDVMFIYVRPGLPLEVIEEYDTWRKVRDLDGWVGWVKGAMLDGRRTVVTKGNVKTLIMSEPKTDSTVVAYAEPGVYAKLESCQGSWCEVSARGYDGFVMRKQLAGIYAHETIK
jgi:SH3-like domain-containing protein